MGQRAGRQRRSWPCLLMIIALAAFLAQGTMAVALAHKGKLPPDALSLVRQAAALLAQDPRMQAEARERLDAALKSTDTRGVDLTRVRQARETLAAGDIPAARRALVEALVSMPAPTAPSAQPAAPPQPGATAPGGMPMTPPPLERGAAPRQEANVRTLMEAMKMSEPLVARFAGTPAEVATVVLGLAFMAAGLADLRPAR